MFRASCRFRFIPDAPEGRLVYGKASHDRYVKSRFDFLYTKIVPHCEMSVTQPMRVNIYAGKNEPA